MPFRVLGAPLTAALCFAILCAPSANSTGVSVAPTITAFRADNYGAPFAGDGRLLTTITPNGDGLRDAARIRFSLSREARVRIQFAVVKSMRPIPVATRSFIAQAGENTIRWQPPAGIEPRTYLVLATVYGAGGVPSHYGKYAARQRLRLGTPVIRVQGVDAAFTEESYRGKRIAELRIKADAPSLTVQIFREGPERKKNESNKDLYGVPMGKPIEVPWTAYRNHPHNMRIWIGDWESGVYYAKLTASDGRAGYAPFIVRPDAIGETRVAVVLPTNTWQAYNHEDEDGDGWGDTWYAGWTRTGVRLHRHFVGWGIPPGFRVYDLGFLHWLVYQGKAVDYLSDTDLDHVHSARVLADAYDLIVFPGHHEYVTQREFGLIRGYRDLGGNLAFLSANNFYWHLERREETIYRTARFRDLGQPEGALTGSSYVANDRGGHMKPWRVVHAVSWLFSGTEARRGSAFGLGGIEVDERSSASPPGTIVIATIPHAIGRHHADMTYYELRGAKVFSAGAFTLAGEATWKPIWPIMENLWKHMTTR